MHKGGGGILEVTLYSLTSGYWSPWPCMGCTEATFGVLGLGLGVDRSECLMTTRRTEWGERTLASSAGCIYIIAFLCTVILPGKITGGAWCDGVVSMNGKLASYNAK